MTKLAVTPASAFFNETQDRHFIKPDGSRLRLSGNEIKLNSD